MIKKAGAQYLIVTDSDCEIIYAKPELSVLSKSKKISNLAQLNFKPKLNNLLKLFQSTREDKPSGIHSYKSLNTSSGKKFIVSIQKSKEDNRFYSIELSAVDEDIFSGNAFSDLLKSFDEDGLFLIFTDGSGKISYSTDIARKYLGETKLTGRKLYDTLETYLSVADKNKLEAAFFDNKKWQATAKFNFNGEIYTSLKLVPVYDEKQRIKNFVLYGSDVTGLMKEKLAYEKVEKLAQAVIKNIPGLIAILKNKDGETVLGDANPNFLKTFGLKKSIVINQDINSIFQSHFLTILKKQINLAQKKGQSYFDVTLKKKRNLHFGGKIVKITGLLDKGNFFILSMRDITDILNYEKQLKKGYDKESYVSKLKTSFLINMASEIRTPYNSVMAYSNLIDEYIEEEDYSSVKELLNSTKNVLKRVLTLFNNVTEVAQIESGNVQIRKVTLNCNEILKLAFYKMREEVDQKNLDFELKLYPEELAIEADWVKIERVLFLLLDNAIKYSSKGKIILQTEKNGNMAEIIIFDTGKGMPEHEVAALLEPFNIQEDDVGISEGAGLGLTIASNYTKLMDGNFNIQSKKGKGTKITLSFPLSKIH